MDEVLAHCPDPPKWKMIGLFNDISYGATTNFDLDEILAPKEKGRLSEAEISQTCYTALQVAPIDLLIAYGVKPNAVMGHSSGEITAVYACGAITAAEAILIAYYRGKVVHGISSNLARGMAAVGLGAKAVAKYLQSGVLIGCENSPSSVTLTGDRVILEIVIENILKDQPEIFARVPRVDRA